jgi:NAD(P)-dependent dehydrogenase (short-subunit alcohol dehydrogenase family)
MAGSVADRFSLAGRVAIVTGSGTGIGRAIALVFAEQGADVVLAGRRREPLEHTAAEVESVGRRALVVPTDVTDPAQCEELVAATIAEFGQVDVLVNNAGGGTTQPPMDWSVDDWHQTLDLNVAGTYYLSREAAKRMLERGQGSIVNISSTASVNPFPIGLPYGAAKAALNNLTTSLAAAWTPHGVRVNALACGGVRTETLLADGLKNGMTADMMGVFSGLGRLAEPYEIATAALFLASDASSYCSGATLFASGGPKVAGM